MRLFLLTFSCAATLLLAGCSDNANSVGNKLINPNEKYVIADTTLYTTLDTVFNVSAPNGYGAMTVAGKTSDMEAKAWLRFLPQTIADSLGGCTIDTVQMHFTVAYTWNAPAAPAEYEIREAITGWTETGLSRDSLPTMQIGTAVLGRITDSLLLGREIVTILDSTSARRWITFALNPTTATPMNGYVIVPKPGMTTGAFGFYSSTSSTLYPTLVIHFAKNGVRDSLVRTVSEDTFIATANVTSKPQLEVRGGVSTWTKVKFDVSGLSKSAIINNASLELTGDPSGILIGNGTPDSLYAFLARNGTGPNIIDSTYRLLGKRKDNTSTTAPVYVFTVTPYLQYLIAPGSPYDGIVLHAANNTACVDHLTFYSSKDPVAANRPRLVVTSSIK